jgi:hypothetical protein
MEILNLINSFDVENTDPNYHRKLQQFLRQSPYNIKMVWSNNLLLLNANKNSDTSLPAVRQSNGLVVDSDTKQVVCYSFNLMQEYSSDNEQLNNELRSNWRDYTVQRLFDGTVIRLVYYNNKWCTMTLKSTNAAKVYWSSRSSFEELFFSAANNLQLDQSALNTNYCYTFILMHPDNQLVVPYNRPNLYLLCTYDLTNNTYVDNTRVNINVSSVPTLTFSTFDALLAEYTSTDSKLPFTEDTNLGYILVNNRTGERVKMETELYKNAKELKGNVPVVNFRIVELIHSSNFEYEQVLRDFVTYFPQYEDNVEKVVKLVKSLPGYLLNVYRKRTMRQEPTDQLLRHTVNELHFISLDEDNYITYPRIEKYLHTLSAARLARLLRINTRVRMSDYHPSTRKVSTK